MPTAEKLSEDIRRYNPALFNAMAIHRTHRGRRLDFARNPFLGRIYQDQSQDTTIIKSTQAGLSEWVICLEVAALLRGTNIFHVLPTDRLVSRFVKERWDKTMLMTPEYQAYVVAEAFGSSAISLKQLGPGTVSFAGSNTANAFTEFVADWFVVDELDRCHQANLEMGWERLSAAETEVRRVIRISNPTISGFGIDDYFAKTDQMIWHIRHDCGEWVAPDFYRHVVRDVGDGQYEYCDGDYDPDIGTGDLRMICHKCEKPINRRGVGDWVPRYPKVAKRGYHVSKLFSANVSLLDLVTRFEKGLVDPAAMQRFENGDLGRAYQSAGAKITEQNILDAEGDWPADLRPEGGYNIAGIDVGSVFHVTIGNVQPGSPGVRLITAKSVRDIDEVMVLLKDYRVKCWVIDALPETRASRQIALAKGGFICYYGKPKEERVTRKVVLVDRTSALDNVRQALLSGGLRTFKGVQFHPDFIPHLTAATRLFDEDANDGNGAYVWREGSRPDHYHHACAYLMIASRIVVMIRG